MKKILILTAGYGEGHNTAARNLRDAILATGEAQAVVCDPLELAYGRVNELVRKAYLATINHAPALWEKIYGMIDSGTALAEGLSLLGPLRTALGELLEKERPDAVVSTYPVYNHFIDPMLADGALTSPFFRFTVVTDSITVNSIWYRCGSDVFIVPNEETAAVLRQGGVPEGKIEVLGFPVSPRFAEARPAKGVPAPGEPWRLLYVINSGKAEAPAAVRELLEIPGTRLTVTVGRDEELRKAVENAAGGRDVEIIGWTDRMPELMCRAHLLISKAGGATVQESLAARTPLIITQVVPGQEEGNARLLTENECGVLAGAGIAPTVRRAIADGGKLWSLWRENLQRLSRPGAAAAIAERILRSPACREAASRL